MEDRTKTLVVKLVKAAVTGLFAQNVIPVVHSAIDVAEWRSSRTASIESRVGRNLPRVTPGATQDERDAALNWASEAVVRARLTLADLAETQFDVDALTEQVARHLPSDLNGRERELARTAIRLTYGSVISDAKREGSALFELALSTARSIKDLSHQIEAAEAGAKRFASPVSTTRGRVDARRLADPTHRDSYFGGRASDVADSLSWDWRSQVQARIETLADVALGETATISHAANELEAIRLDDTCPSVWRRLQSRTSRSALKVLSDTPAEPRFSRQRREAARWLTAQIDRPEFGLAYPVTGQWGSGKSRLLDEVAEMCMSRDWLVVFVDARSPNSLMDNVLGAVSRSLGVTLESPAALRRESACQRGVCVLIDDWDVALRRNVLRNSELINLMGDLSDLPVRWVLAMDESALPMALSRGGSRSWASYGWRRRLRRELAVPLVSGWLQLADDNESRKVGLDLLAHYLGSTPEIMAVRRGVVGSRFVRRELSQPLLALLRVDAGADTALDEVHLVSVFGQYWERLLDAVASDETLTPELIDAICGGIASGILTGAEVSADDSTHVEPLNRLLPADRESTRDEVLRLLLSRNLLAVSGEAIGPDEAASLVWGFLLSREVVPWDRFLRDFSPLEFLNRMHRLADLESSGVPAAGAALRFTMLAAMSGAVQAERVSEIDLPWLLDPMLPTEVLWEAAPALPLARQIELMAASEEVPATAREGFWAIRIVRLLPNEINSEHALIALRFLTRVSSHADQDGLSDYLLTSLRRCIRVVDWSPTGDAGEALHLLESVGIPELSAPLADAVVAQLEFADPSARADWLAVVMSFLSTVTPRARARPGEPAPFWEALTQASLDDMARHAGPQLLAELFDHGWYSTDDSREQDVSWVMRRIGHVAFGHTWKVDPDGFMEILRGLLNHEFEAIAPDRQAAAALFGIRHSTSTHGGHVLVDDSFGPALEMLAKDRHLSQRDRRALLLISPDNHHQRAHHRPGL